TVQGNQPLDPSPCEARVHITKLPPKCQAPKDESPYVFLASRIVPHDKLSMRFPLVCLLVLLSLVPLRAAEKPFFQKNDVIALVGGEDMVVAGEDGYLELLLLRALPDYHLRFRSLAWEGDTVFEQNRDLNFPTWEEALDKIGATVV